MATTQRRPAPRFDLDSLVPARRHRGPIVAAGLCVALAVLWLAVGPPSGVGWGSFAGQLAGAEAVLLLSISLVLISLLPQIEAWFDGIDRAAIWHRRAAVAGLLLVVAPHQMLAQGDHRGGAGGPLATIGMWGLIALVVWAVLPRWRSMLPLAPVRAVAYALRTSTAVQAVWRPVHAVVGGYERWRAVHRLTGLFLAAGAVHGLLDATVFGSAVLRWTYVGIAGVGLGMYLYRETVARYVLPLHDYQVAEVRRVAADVTELRLAPVGRPMRFEPGQFAMLFLEGNRGWRRHPFTLSGGSQDADLRFTIKALGDDTAALPDQVSPGMPAVVGGPHGRFHRGRGTAVQLWIAGGIGVTPFLSWLRSLGEQDLREQVDFFYTTIGPAPFAEEIRQIAEAHPNLRVHLHDSEQEGFLTPGAALAATGADPREVSVFLCGPAGMVNAFVRALRGAGVRTRNLHREHFTWR